MNYSIRVSKVERSPLKKARGFSAKKKAVRFIGDDSRMRLRSASKISRPATSCKSVSEISESVTVWGEEDEEVISALISRCKMFEENPLQTKLDFFYKSLGISSDNRSMMPMSFEREQSEEMKDLESYYKNKSKQNWGKMKDVILNSKSEILREFLKTINALKYPQLKAYIKQINSAEFATVVNYLKNFPSEDELDAKLVYAKDAIKQIDELLENELEQLNRENSAEIREKTSKKFCDHLNLSLFQKDGISADSLISSLLLFKRSELDRVVSKISKYQSKLRRRSKRRISMKIVSELSKKSIPKYELTRIAKKTVKKVSDSKLTLFIFSQKARARSETPW